MEAGMHSINAMRSMEVIEINKGQKIGFIYDVKIDCENDKVEALILGAPSKGWFQKNEDIEIPWENIVKIGEDVILVSGENLNLQTLDNNMYR